MPAAAIFLHSGSYDRILQGLSIANTYIFSQYDCYLFWFYEALYHLVNDSLDSQSFELHPILATMKEVEHTPPSQLFKNIQNHQNLHNYACSASAQLLMIPAEKVNVKVKAIIGWPTILRLTKDIHERYYL